MAIFGKQFLAQPTIDANCTLLFIEILEMYLQCADMYRCATSAIDCVLSFKGHLSFFLNQSFFLCSHFCFLLLNQFWTVQHHLGIDNYRQERHFTRLARNHFVFWYMYWMTIVLRNVIPTQTFVGSIDKVQL